MVDTIIFCRGCGGVRDKLKPCEFCEKTHVATIEVGHKMMSFSSCSDITDFWRDEWKHCPFCGVPPDEEGIFTHIGPRRRQLQ